MEPLTTQQRINGINRCIDKAKAIHNNSKIPIPQKLSEMMRCITGTKIIRVKISSAPDIPESHKLLLEDKLDNLIQICETYKKEYIKTDGNL